MVKKSTVVIKGADRNYSGDKAKARANSGKPLIHMQINKASPKTSTEKPSPKATIVKKK